MPQPDFSPFDPDPALALRLLCEAWLLKNWLHSDNHPEVTRLSGLLNITGGAPKLPDKINITSPVTRDDWLKPFQNEEDASDPLPAILNAMPSQETKAAVETFFAPNATFPPKFDGVADVFLKLSAALRAAS